MEWISNEPIADSAALAVCQRSIPHRLGQKERRSAAVKRDFQLTHPRGVITRRNLKFADSPLEESGFEPSVPRCARTADSAAVL
jgi:hypothetical protein